MASVVAKTSNSASQVLPTVPVQDKGSRNKRKFRADSFVSDTNTFASLSQNECSNYEFSAEKFEITKTHEHHGGCKVCTLTHDNSDALKLDLGLSTGVGSSQVSSRQSEIEVENDFSDADWSDLTESQLQELLLKNLDTIFKSAIKMIAGCGYSEEVASKSVLHSGIYFGCKDIVSNIVENALTILRNGQEIDSTRERCFEDLEQMEKYILAELVCVLREIRPSFSMGDAMWCLLICDMNVSHACAMDGSTLSSLSGDAGLCGSDSGLGQPPIRTENTSSEIQISDPCKLNPSNACAHTCECVTATMDSVFLAHSQSETTAVSLVPDFVKPNNSSVLNGHLPDKESPISTSDKSIGNRKNSGITKREYVLRQKSLHLEKSHRTYGSKGSSRAGKPSGFGGLIFDKKMRSLSDSGSLNVKSAAMKINKTTTFIDMPQDKESHNLLTNNELPSEACLESEIVNSVSDLPKASSPSTVSDPPALSTADTELSLSLSLPTDVSADNGSSSSIAYDLSLSQWVPQDKKGGMILKLVPRVRDLHNQLQEWTEWANQKVMQAARRLGKDKAELKTLRQEREEVERLKREKQTLEESTMKKLSEMENALHKASGQVERANGAVRRLDVENTAIKQEMEAAKLKAAESAASCLEVLKREKNTVSKIQSWEKQKAVFQEELLAEKRKVAQLEQEVEQAKDKRDQQEARWKQEEKAKEELLNQASSNRKEREELEASTQSKEDMIKLKTETNLQKYKDDIKKLEKEISQLRLKTDSSRIAALRRGIDGSYSSRATDVESYLDPKEPHFHNLSRTMAKLEEYSGAGGVKRERECVMCLSEEMSIVFLPCAHQVVCAKCNELHEKQGMKECPSCRSMIQQRICVRYAEP